MLRSILNTVPLTLLLVAAVSVSVGVVLLAVWLIRRTVPATTEGFHAAHFGFHALCPAAIALVVAVSLVVLLDLSYPLSGDVAIAPDDFRTGALDQFFPAP